MPESDQPPQRAVGRPISMTPAVKVAACEHVAAHGWNPGNCAFRSGCSTATLYRAIHADPAFADALGVAKGVFLQSLEVEAHRRAVVGVEMVKSLDKEGNPIYTRVYSDKLLSELLRANGPSKYGQRIQVDKTVSGRVSHEHTARIDVAKLQGEDRAALRGVLQRNRITVAREEDAQEPGASVEGDA